MKSCEVKALSLPPCRATIFENSPGGMLLGALEHQMLEEVRQAGLAGRAVGRADPVPDPMRHDRRPVVRRRTTTSMPLSRSKARDGTMAVGMLPRPGSARSGACGVRVAEPIRLACLTRPPAGSQGRAGAGRARRCPRLGSRGLSATGSSVGAAAADRSACQPRMNRKVPRSSTASWVFSSVITARMSGSGRDLASPTIAASPALCGDVRRRHLTGRLPRSVPRGRPTGPPRRSGALRARWPQAVNPAADQSGARGPPGTRPANACRSRRSPAPACRRRAQGRRQQQPAER